MVATTRRALALGLALGWTVLPALVIVIGGAKRWS